MLRGEHATVRAEGFTDRQATLQLAMRHNLSTRQVETAIRR